MLLLPSSMLGSRPFRAIHSRLPTVESRVSDAEVQKKETLTFDDDFAVREFLDDLPTIFKVL
jgi:hypothetical protein